MWHEAAHEWWGNSITSKDIADMWIHEAFATYAEIQVIEHRFGKEAVTGAVHDQYEAVMNKEPVIGAYDVNHIYYDIGDMYSKGSLSLHTFRNVLNDDKIWVSLLHDIQKKFRYKTLSSDELVKFINERTKSDYTYLFDQYLKFTTIPVLELDLKEKGTDLLVRYRWVADVKNFKMPIRITKSAGQFEFIYPTQEWKEMNLKNISMDQFEVDEDNFYIEVDSN
jgi:aminopeptidase N